MIEFLQSPKLITYLKTNTDVRGILNQSDYKCIKGEILKDSKFITNCVVKFNINDEIFSPEEKQGALDFSLEKMNKIYFLFLLSLIKASTTPNIITSSSSSIFTLFA